MEGIWWGMKSVIEREIDNLIVHALRVEKSLRGGRRPGVRRPFLTGVLVGVTATAVWCLGSRIMDLET